MNAIRAAVVVEHDKGKVATVLTRSPGCSVLAMLRDVAVANGLPLEGQHVTAVCNGRALRLEETLGGVTGAFAGDTVVELHYRLRAVSAAPSATDQRLIAAWAEGVLNDSREALARLVDAVATRGSEGPELRAPAPPATAGKKRLTQPVVRYYQRMRPNRRYPLVVVLTSLVLKELLAPDTEQRFGRPFSAILGAPIEVVPDLPGCLCVPPAAALLLEADRVQKDFAVTPLADGTIDGARVLFRQGGQLLGEVPLDVEVNTGFVWRTFAVLNLAVPGLMSGLQQMDAVKTVLPQWTWLAVGVALLGMTVWSYYRSKPRWQEVLDVVPATPLTQYELAAAAFADGDTARGVMLMNALARNDPDFQPAWLFCGHRALAAGRHDEALALFQKAFTLGGATVDDYRAAVVAAGRADDDKARADVLAHAKANLPADDFPRLQQRLTRDAVISNQ